MMNKFTNIPDSFERVALPRDTPQNEVYVAYCHIDLTGKIATNQFKLFYPSFARVMPALRRHYEFTDARGKLCIVVDREYNKESETEFCKFVFESYLFCFKIPKHKLIPIYFAEMRGIS